MSIKRAIKRFLKFAEIKLYPTCPLCGSADPYIDDDNPLCYRCGTPENIAKMKGMAGIVKNRFSSLELIS